VKYRAPGASDWEEKPLDWAMERIAQLVKKTRDENWNETFRTTDKSGKNVDKKVSNTPAVASLGGATLDNEWNYMHLKLMRALGVIWLENQARI
jgi:formate dehydrogenase major subunit